MIWTTNTHSFSATFCQKTGKPCPVARKMILNLALAMSKAEDMTEAGFELTGTCQLKGCAAGCTARYVATHDRITLFCDVRQDADQTQLDLFADAMFTPGRAGVPLAAGPACPSAMVRANRRVQREGLAPEAVAAP